MDYQLGKGWTFQTIHGNAEHVRYIDHLLMWTIGASHYQWDPFVKQLSVQHPTGAWMPVTFPSEDFADTVINPLFAVLQVPNHEEITYGIGSTVDANIIDPTTFMDEATKSGVFSRSVLGTAPSGAPTSNIKGLSSRPVTTSGFSFVSKSWAPRYEPGEKPIAESYPREVS